MPPIRSLAAFFIALAATQFGCNGKSPTAPTQAPEHGLQRLEIEVPASLAPDRTFLPGQPSSPALVLAPGASVQLTAKGYLADGTSRDVTREVYWRSGSSRGNASVFLGLVQAHRPGMETLLVHIGSDDTYLEAHKEVLVMSDGTFALRGSLRDASSGRSISGATVSVVGSAFSTTQSGSDGSYVLWSVPPVADIAASLPGYRSKVQRVALADHNTRLDFALDEETPLARLAGTYRLTLVADSNCTVYGTAFPDELRVRTYTADVTQVGNELTVTLSGATFHPASWRRFTGRVSPGVATFWLIERYWLTSDFDGDVVEQPSPRTALIIGGDATISTSSLAGGLNGTLEYHDLDEPASSRWSSCGSPNHQFRMSR